MQQFKVGDRVRHKIAGTKGNVSDLNENIASGSYGQIQVSFDFESRERTVSVGDLELWEPFKAETSSPVPVTKEEFAKTVTAFSSEDPTVPQIKEIGKMAEALGISSFEQSVRRHTDRIADVLVQKNLSYGDSALNPVRIFSKADRMEQLYIRLDDKISRVKSGHEYPGDDTLQDIIGYCLLVLIARESN